MRSEQYDNYFKFRGVTPDEAKNAQVPAWLAKVLPPSKDTAILDIGCGFGRLLSALQRAGYTNISGIDLEDSAVAYCCEAGLEVSKASVLDFVPPHGPYDVAVMSHVLEHIPKKETICLLRAIRTSILKPSGTFIVMVPNAQSNTGCYWMYEDWTHETLFTAGSLLYVLRVAGFDEITFADPQCVEGMPPWRAFLRKVLLRIYEWNFKVWNSVTCSAFHAPSPRIYSFELKALARSSHGSAGSP